MAHEEPYMAHVGPGSFDFACLMAGHYQAGMAGKISVAASTR